MSDILTVTLNPCVDLATAAPKVVAGPKLRCEVPRIDPGGGGVNVSRAVALLGGESTAFVAHGGATGARLLGLLQAAGIAVNSFAIAGDTRQSVAVTDRSSGGQYRFVLPGPEWTGTMAEGALHAIGMAMTQGMIVVLSGSQPPGVADSFLTALAQVATDHAARLIVDTSGGPLAQLAAGGGVAPYVLRMDQAEAEDLAGRALVQPMDAAGFAAELVARGVAQVVVVSLGAEGSVLVDATQRWHCRGADVPVVSKIGAGDSFVGAFALALARGTGLPEALQCGVAAASAAVMTEATMLFEAEQARALIAECPLVQLD